MSLPLPKMVLRISLVPPIGPVSKPCGRAVYVKVVAARLAVFSKPALASLGA
jgi:hypothetical protein